MTTHKGETRSVFCCHKLYYQVARQSAVAVIPVDIQTRELTNSRRQNTRDTIRINFGHSDEGPSDGVKIDI